jgi:hypothetical protein
MRSTILALGAALMLAAHAAPAAAVRDFRLPPSPSQQQPPDRVGPVAPDVPESRMPAPTPTPTPTAVRPATPTPGPAATLAVPPEGSEPAEPRPGPAVRPAPGTRPPEAALPGPATPADSAETSPDAAVPVFEGFPQAPLDAASPTAAEAKAASGGAWWPWLLAALIGIGAALGAAAWLWRRRESAPVAVPQIERPRLAPEAAPAPPADTDGPAGAAEPLQVALEPLRLSLTLLNATLAYRLELANRGATALTGLSIGADMIAAHASMSREEQLAGPAGGGAVIERIERLEPGESRIVQGEFRVPFSQIVPIRQGSAALLLPLARFRLEADGAAPVVRTFAVGQPGPQAGLQPFRLDQGPRVYPKLIQRAFA